MPRQTTCPHCGAKLTGKSYDINAGVWVCPHCDTVFDETEPFRALDDKSRRDHSQDQPTDE